MCRNVKRIPLNSGIAMVKIWGVILRIKCLDSGNIALVLRGRFAGLIKMCYNGAAGEGSGVAGALPHLGSRSDAAARGIRALGGFLYGWEVGHGEDGQ